MNTKVASQLRHAAIAALMATTLLSSPSSAQEHSEIKLTSAGPIAFGPNGLLLVSDPMAATIYAIETGDSNGSTDGVNIEVPAIRTKIAAMMGTKKEDVRINDLAVNPSSGNVYLSVSRGTGKDQLSTILKVDAKTKKLGEFELSNVKFTKTALNNAAESKQARGGNQRLMSITDMAFVNDQVYVAGLSNEEFASNLRSLEYPFRDAAQGASIEIYHGAHGAYETRSPVRTFAAYDIDNEVNLLAAYTCTPLVRIPVGQLKDGNKVKGTTIAELGNRNRPLDIVVYTKSNKDYALMANSSRGVMKIELANAGKQEAITERVNRGGTAGIPYTTIKELEGVLQLDGLNDTHAVILQQDDQGNENLTTIPLP